MTEKAEVKRKVSHEEIPDDDLRATDRCDRCQAQAYVRAVFSGGELLFCGHHYNAYEEAINAQSLVVTDQRERLLV